MNQQLAHNETCYITVISCFYSITFLQNIFISMLINVLFLSTTSLLLAMYRNWFEISWTIHHTQHLNCVRI